MNLHQFYFEVWTAARNKKWRIGQALFNCLLEIRPDMAEQLRGMDIDPFYATSPTDPAYDAAIRAIEANWFKAVPIHY